MEKRSGMAWAGALSGAVLGAGLPMTELFLVSIVDPGGLSWFSLGAVPLMVWSVGLIAGCAIGLTLAWPMALSSDRIGVLLFLVYTGVATLVHVNHQWLPDPTSPRSLASSGILVIVFVVLALLAWARLTRASGVLLCSWKRLALLLLAGFAVALPALWGIPPPPVMSRWEPIATPAPAPARNESGSRSLLILGIDGGRWETIDPLLRAGSMPNLAALVERGRRGVLRCVGSSASPVAWTTIMTGQRPEVHGITRWGRAVSVNRRVKSLWRILEEHRWRNVVLGVPGSYPAENLDGGAVMGGVPFPQSAGSNLGWLVTSDGEADIRGPLRLSIPPLPLDGEAVRVTLLDRSAGLGALEGIAPWIVFKKVSETAAGRIMRHLLETPLVASGAAELDLSWRKERGVSRVSGQVETDSLLFDLAPGEWGPWLRVGSGSARYLIRPRLIAAEEGKVRLFFTALFREDPPGLSQPPELTASLHRPNRPYLSEGTGWSVFYERTVLAPLEEHLTGLAEVRAEAALGLMDNLAWDAFINVFTVTDRIQHSFWKFREPDLYGRLEGSPLYSSHRPTSEQVARFGGAVDRIYESLDGWIGRMVERAGPSTLIMVLSDHGAQGGPYSVTPTAGPHHEDGLYLIAGPTITPAEVALSDGPLLDQEDVVPLILAHVGLPLAGDMPGEIPDALMPRSADGTPLALPEMISSYETGIGSSADESIDEEMLEQLRSLGYIK